MNREKDYMTSGEVAKFFEVTRQQIVRYANDGRLPYQRTPGGTRHFDKQKMIEIKESLDSNREGQGNDQKGNTPGIDQPDQGPATNSGSDQRNT